jgi:RNA polymerase sigma factor (sigma-70 family)
LGHEQDAEDAFQATFLVLARNADSLRNKTSLASFLHGTAYRISLKARQTAARRRKHEEKTPPRSPADPTAELSWREVKALLDEEIARLPEIYRVVFVLFYLETLSLAETARRLELKEATAAKRLAEARKRLGQRLRRRGVELTAVLSAVALASPPVSALPVELTASTIRAAMTTANEGLAGVVPAPIAALVESCSPILSFGKAKLAMLLLAVGVLSGSGAWMYFQPSAAVSGASPVQEKTKPQPSAGPVVKEDKENATYAGRVLDPDGKPVAGAKLYLLYYTPKELPIPVRATSDKDGRFRFTVARKDFDQSHSKQPWDEAVIVATANGYGLGLPDFQRGKRLVLTDLSLRLPKDDVPLTGRVLDLQGKPIAGVSVSVHGIFWSAKEDLAAWLAELKEKQEGYTALRNHLIGLEGLWMGRDVGKVFPPVATGADGRFTLPGAGRERVVALRLQGATTAVAELYCMTRPGETLKVAQWRRGDRGGEMTFCGSGFEHIAALGQTIIGIVRDKDTGKPIPGAVVQSYMFFSSGIRLAGQTQLKAVADKEGRYRLDGMPKGKGNEIRARGPDGEPYLMSLAEVPEAFALEPVTVDVRLKRGVWVHCKVTEKATGRPVHSFIRCSVHDENPFRREAPGLTLEEDWGHADGTFRFVGLPGRSVVMGQTGDPRYLSKVGSDRIKDLNRFNIFQPYNAIVEINPDKDAKEVKCNLVFETGGTLSGKVVDSQGQPLSGAKAAGLSQSGEWEHEALKSPTFTVTTLRPGDTRLLQFTHAEKHLAGSLVVHGDAKGPLTVTLKPAGMLKGRFITPDGNPLADLEFFADVYGLIADPRMVPKADPTIGTFPRGHRTGKDGTFRVEDLASGLKYRFMLRKGMYVLTPDGPAGTGVSVKEGETKNLGDVTVKLIE